MIPVMNATVEFRFKKSQPTLEAKLSGMPARPQIFLQQKFYIQNYNEENIQDMIVPIGADPSQVIPQQLMPYVKVVGPSDKGLVIKVPVLEAVYIRWFNVPAVEGDAPDIEQIERTKMD